MKKNIISSFSCYEVYTCILLKCRKQNFLMTPSFFQSLDFLFFDSFILVDSYHLFPYSLSFPLFFQLGLYSKLPDPCLMNYDLISLSRNLSTLVLLCFYFCYYIPLIYVCIVRQVKCLFQVTVLNVIFQTCFLLSSLLFIPVSVMACLSPLPEVLVILQVITSPAFP